MKNFGKNSVWSISYVVLFLVGCFFFVASCVAIYATHKLFGIPVLDNLVSWGQLLGPAFIVIGVYGLYEDYKEANSEEKKARARHARVTRAKENVIKFPR